MKSILDDLTNRKGLSSEWDCIDQDIQKEIIDKWIEIAEKLV